MAVRDSANFEYFHVVLDRVLFCEVDAREFLELVSINWHHLY